MAESNVAAAPKETQQSAKPTRKGSLLSRVAYSFGNVGQSAFYNALSTYFIVYVQLAVLRGRQGAQLSEQLVREDIQERGHP